MSTTTARAAGRTMLVAALSAATMLGCSGNDTEDTDAFCAALRAARLSTSAVEQVDLDDPDSVQVAVGELEALGELAPDSLRADVEIVTEVFGEILQAVATTAPSARGDVLRSLQPRIDEANQPAIRLQDFGATTCGITFDAPARPTPTPTPLVDVDD